MGNSRLRFLFGSLLLCAMLVFCVPMTQVGHAETSDLIEKRRAQLKAQLKVLEGLIERQQVLLSDKRTERVSLERDLDIIDAEIEKARIAIRAQEMTIANLEDDIVDKEVTILELTEKIAMEKESLASFLRRTDELDELTLVELVLSEKSFSEFFEEVDDFEAVKVALHASFIELESLLASNESAKLTLEERKEDEGELKKLQQLQQEKLKDQESEKARILTTTKGEEVNYQKLLTTTERSASQIRSELFELRGSSAINLGDAIEFATFAGLKTGVRPALILGILKQETRLGEFLGNGNWREDMKPSRDQPLFRVITKTLGLDPDAMPVSAAPSYGYGGAMGPAQFIPSTWACYGGYINTNTGDCNNKLRSYTWDEFWAGPWVYKKDADRLRSVRGKQSPSNPWDNQDAFIGSSLLMKDNGADAGTLYAERLAALRYFAGWVNASNPAYAFYGDGVMEHAAYYQKQIDTLQRLSE